jgi:hypothetical protein
MAQKVTFFSPPAVSTACHGNCDVLGYHASLNRHAMSLELSILSALIDVPGDGSGDNTHADQEEDDKREDCTDERRVQRRRTQAANAALLLHADERGSQQRRGTERRTQAVSSLGAEAALARLAHVTATPFVGRVSNRIFETVAVALAGVLTAGVLVVDYSACSSIHAGVVKGRAHLAAVPLPNNPVPRAPV